MTKHYGLQPLPGHYGHEDRWRLDEVTHMCPDCGIEPRIFCRWCKGSGVLTELQLSIWQADANRRFNAGEVTS